ncbi:hypothetical protein BJ912DRAFT_524 [Pholiota molesta]|nr:hypothetical protein BJ912DRAFT_524 [Pholiota molesta]
MGDQCFDLRSASWAYTHAHRGSRYESSSSLARHARPHLSRGVFVGIRQLGSPDFASCTIDRFTSLVRIQLSDVDHVAGTEDPTAESRPAVDASLRQFSSSAPLARGVIRISKHAMCAYPRRRSGMGAEGAGGEGGVARRAHESTVCGGHVHSASVSPGRPRLPLSRSHTRVPLLSVPVGPVGENCFFRKMNSGPVFSPVQGYDRIRWSRAVHDAWLGRWPASGSWSRTRISVAFLMHAFKFVV